MEIVVVANAHRPPIITPYLDSVKAAHLLSITPDLPLPETRDWPLDWLNHNTIGAYRCFEGHQHAIMRLISATDGSDEPILVLEDDARPHWDDWFQQTVKATALLKGFEVVSLHGRRVIGDRHKWPGGPQYAVCKYGRHGVDTKQRKDGVFEGYWACGSLAYLVTAETARKIIAMPYDGMPMDLVLVNRFKAAIIDPSPFLHDRQHGSLVENPK